MPPDTILEHVTADVDNRITVPKELCDCVPWLQGTEELEAWILLIAPGRYRLLSDEQVQNDPQLEPVRSLLLGGRSASLVEPTFALESRRAVIVAKLLKAKIAPYKPRWRITFPKAFSVFVPPDCDPKAFSILFCLEGYLEIWYTDVLRKEVFLSLNSQQ